MSSRQRYIKTKGALQEATAPAAPGAAAVPGGANSGQQTASLHAEALPVARAAPRSASMPAARLPEPAAAAGSGLDSTPFFGRRSVLFYTVPDGHQVLATDRKGRVEIIQGPARVLALGRRFQVMRHYVAHPGEFLIVQYRSGRQEHLAGPAECWQDPREHLAIRKEEAVQIADKEAVVVYSEDAEGVVSRRIVSGPASFVPGPGEWLHTFSWHGSAPDGSYRKVPNGMVFQKLWQLPDQMYHDVEGVRTDDDAQLTVKLMIFFELVDIERMLASTHDPIGDFVNAATSDVVEFLGRRTFDTFKRDTDKLNDLGTYRQLTARAEQCGYRIDKVVYRGYAAPPALQKLHDQATESRVRLQLERATEQQAQELEDMKLERKLGRALKTREQEAAAQEHELALEARAAAALLEREAARRAAEREQEHLDAQAAEQREQARQAREREHLRALGALGVDLTALLTQGRADRIVELRGAAESPHIHLDG